MSLCHKTVFHAEGCVQLFLTFMCSVFWFFSPKKSFPLVVSPNKILRVIMGDMLHNAYPGCIMYFPLAFNKVSLSSVICVSQNFFSRFSFQDYFFRCPACLKKMSYHPFILDIQKKQHSNDQFDIQCNNTSQDEPCFTLHQKGMFCIQPFLFWRFPTYKYMSNRVVGHFHSPSIMEPAASHHWFPHRSISEQSML